MTSLQYNIFSFPDLSPALLYAYLQLRSEVFVVEQNCVYQDLDGQDQDALHVLVRENDRLVACARILPKDTNYPEISIGRVIVALNYRGKNVGHAWNTASIRSMNYMANKILSCQRKPTCKSFIKSTTLYPSEIPTLKTAFLTSK